MRMMRTRTQRAAVIGLCAAVTLLSGCFLLPNELPVASFRATPPDGSAPLSVTFDASGSYDPDGAVSAYRWSFGDGVTGSGMVVAHVYATAGTYTVQLTVEDGRQATDSASLEILVRSGSKYAIVVGVANYPPPTPVLGYTDDDAVAFGQRLATLPGWDPDNILVLTNLQATTVAFRAALDIVSSIASADDTLVIFFSGHGNYYTDGNGDEADGYDEALLFYDTVLLDDTLARWLEDTTTLEIGVFIDACFSGGQLDSRGVQSRGADRNGGFADDLARIGGIRTKDLDRVPRQIAAVTASRFDETSWELATLQHGIFTYYLLQALGGPADAAGDMDGQTSVEECFAYLEPRVASHAASIGESQLPQMLDHCAGELVIAGTP
jgi:PKD repeat protein